MEMIRKIKLMNDNEIDLIAEIVLSISKKHEEIIKILPKANDQVFKHLAASSIHLAIFMKDLKEMTDGKKFDLIDGLENKFLDECGCNDDKGKLN
jgi:hypothetical protein